MTQKQSQFLRSSFEKYSKAMVIYTTKRTGNEYIAAELVSEVFLIATVKINKLMESINPAGWLYNTLKNVVRSELRKSHYTKEVFVEEGLENIGVDFTDNISLADQLPVGLSSKEQQILIWRYEDQLDYNQISGMLGIPLGTCRVRLHRAQEKCRKLIESEK